MKLLLEAIIARCCGAKVIISAQHAEGHQFKPGQHQGQFSTNRSFFTWLKLRPSILFLVNATFDMNLLLKGLIAICCGVTVITSAGLEFKPDSIKESFEKLKFFYLIKFKIMQFISGQSKSLYKITAQRTNRKVLWRNGGHLR